MAVLDCVLRDVDVDANRLAISLLPRPAKIILGIFSSSAVKPLSNDLTGVNPSPIYAV